MKVMEQLQNDFKIRSYILKDIKDRINPLRTRHIDAKTGKKMKQMQIFKKSQSEMRKEIQIKVKESSMNLHIFKERSRKKNQRE